LETQVKPYAALVLEAVSDAEAGTGAAAGLVDAALGRLRGAGAIR
jgi:hypothetical protein